MVVILVTLFQHLSESGHGRSGEKGRPTGLPGKMEGPAEVDTAVTEGPIIRRILSERGTTAIVTTRLSVWKDVAGGR
jgi:hypothetical protein